jgi:GTP cyclohydrolase I
MVDRRAAARAIEDFLRALGHEISGELVGTGERVAQAWADDLLEGETVDAAALLREGSIELGAAGASLVVLRDLHVTTMCPHHLLPAIGTALVAYLPGRRVAGLGTIARVVELAARRLTLQEEIGARVVDLLARELGVRGALCKLQLSHTCMVSRGERRSGAVVETIAFGGSFAEDGPSRSMALTALASR